MKDSPLVSVIIPVYNYERFLAEAIESVLSQTYRELEVIVVDDGSTDRSGEVARSFAGKGVSYCHQVHAGIGPARNKGVELARGDFLAFLDADDRWPEEKLERQLRAFEDDPALEMVLARRYNFRMVRRGKQESVTRASLYPAWFRAWCLVRCSSSASLFCAWATSRTA